MRRIFETPPTERSPQERWLRNSLHGRAPDDDGDGAGLAPEPAPTTTPAIAAGVRTEVVLHEVPTTDEWLRVKVDADRERGGWHEHYSA
jgi:hypothetical protein